MYPAKVGEAGIMKNNRNKDTVIVACRVPVCRVTIHRQLCSVQLVNLLHGGQDPQSLHQHNQVGVGLHRRRYRGRLVPPDLHQKNLDSGLVGVGSAIEDLA